MGEDRLARVTPVGMSSRKSMSRARLLIILAFAFIALALIAESAVAVALPDGRIYEQVSPANKNGNYVAGGEPPISTEGGYSRAAGDGNALVFMGSGAMGDASSSLLQPYVARRSPGVGWVTRSAIPPQLGVTNLLKGPRTMLVSDDFSSFAFSASTAYSPEQPLSEGESVDLYLSKDPFVPPTWLGKPTIPDPIPKAGGVVESPYLVVGASPSLNAVYFIYSGTLVPEDASRAPNVGDGRGLSDTAPWGFYEWREGALGLVGVLPNGTVSPFGALPAAMAGNGRQALHPAQTSWEAVDFNGEISADGSRVFFVSPDVVTPSDPRELYAREIAPDGTRSTVLVSQSRLPGHVGEPAPGGVVSVADAAITRIAVENGGVLDSTDVYASTDGSHAFFASRDRLTESAPEDTTIKEYDFDLNTSELTYLPGVIGPIVASARDGSAFIFKNTATTPEELDLWSGPNDGRLTTIAQLPPPEAGNLRGEINVEARAAANGAVFVFNTNAPVPGFNNGGGFGQVYRYDVASNALVCVSCPPAGVTPSGDAHISYDNGGGANSRPKSTVDTRVISSDGARVFFDTPDPLVPQDSNGKRDVYEWENGSVSLISSGTDLEESFYLDSSESGNDVFFNTTDGIAPGDTDDAYDAYDARVPRPGETLPPSAVPCQGDVCQGPPSVPSLLGAPPTATFSGAGNLAPAEANPPAKKKAMKKKKKKKKKKPRYKTRKRGKQARKSIATMRGQA